VDGGFERGDAAWRIPQTTYPAAYTTAVAHSGQRAMRLGMEADDNVFSYSTVWQPIHVPAGVDAPLLTFWYYPISTDTARDLEYALILDASGNILDWVLSTRSNAQVWRSVEYSLSAYRGADIRISFGVYNDGGGGATTMYVDDVSVKSCGQPVLAERLFLPLVLRSFGLEGAQEGATESSLAGTGFPSKAQTLWQPAESAHSPSFEQGIALDPARNVLYMAAGKELWALDAESGSMLARIAMQSAPRSLAVDVATNRVYAALWQEDAVALVDGTSYRVLQVVRGIPGASGLAVAKDVVYVTATRSDELIVIDKTTGGIIQRVTVGDAPYAVACDEGSRQWAFVANAGEDTLSIVGAGAVLRTVKLGGLGHPQGLALDAVRDCLYVTYSLSPKYGAIAAIDATSGQVLVRLTGSFLRPLFAAYGVTADPLRGWVYVTTAEETLVLAGETLSVLHALPDVGPASGFGVRVDAVGERLYVAERRQGSLLVCDR
jgi:YVTN family beta-propeller protein